MEENKANEIIIRVFVWTLLTTTITATTTTTTTTCSCVSHLVYELITSNNWSPVTFIFDENNGKIDR
ncbi:hypothetical protein E2C01_085755 [Portunus trituberculatus]|uniref:Uncharacterized protein n=1 Tax=Portunus trituberculatus TaxID=210409 RepID=A0A5B7JBJ1_PORTR|nr:hypothetical protein [Portunus trituberculatus]